MKSLLFILALLIVFEGPARVALSQEIPSDTIRIDEVIRYKPLPNFKGSIEFIRDGVENDALLNQYLSPSTVRFVKDQHLHWLQVRDAYIDLKGISPLGQSILVPIIASVRYQKVAHVIDGTLNGLFQIDVDSSGSAKVKLIAIDDNAFIQRLGRLFWNIDYKNFVNTVAGQTLRVLLQNPQTVQGISALSRH